MKGHNKYYKLMTEEDIADTNTRIATNCFIANHPKHCMGHKCQVNFPHFWKVCPKQTNERVPNLRNRRNIGKK